MNYTETKTSTEAETEETWFCTICKRRGHTATHHKIHPDIYD